MRPNSLGLNYLVTAVKFNMSVFEKSSEVSFEVKKEVFPEYFIMSATGDYSFETMLNHVAVIKDEADNLGLKRVLIDAGNFTGRMSESERFLGGQKIAEIFGSKIRPRWFCRRIK